MSKIDWKQIAKQGGGFVPVKDPRDRIYEDIFGAPLGGPIVPLGRIEQIKDSPLTKRENILSQRNALGCVPTHITWMNQFFSWFNQKSEVHLSWPMPYALADWYVGKGTNVNNVLSIVRHIGQCLDKTFSEDSMFENGGDRYIHNPALVTPAMKEEGKNWRIGDYSRLSDNSIATIYDALKHAPVLLGVTLANWDDAVIYSPSNAVNHLTLAVDVTKEGNLILIEMFDENFLDVRVLDKRSFIGMAYSFRDMPDGFFPNPQPILNEEDMQLFRLIKSKYDNTEEDKKVFLLNSEGKKCWVFPEISFEQIFGKKAWGSIELLEREEMANFPLGPTLDVRREGFLEALKMMVKSLGAKK